MALQEYNWDQIIESMIKDMESSETRFVIKNWAISKDIPYFELCRQWSQHPKYQPITARRERGSRLIREGVNSFSNIVFPQEDIKFIQKVKVMTSPIRFYILRHLLSGPCTIADFIIEHEFAYNTTAHAFDYLERMQIIRICGFKDKFNLYEIGNEEAMRNLFTIIEEL